MYLSFDTLGVGMAIESMAEQECISAIEQGKTFHADIADGAFTIKIESDVPFICTAIHDGHRLRDDLVKNCTLSDAERYYEEDPYTGEFISDMPITVIAHDSRYEYDLNRSPEDAVYEEAWGKVVWKTPLTEEQKIKSLEKHNAFYRVMRALYHRVLQQNGAGLVYDVHSYNFKRKEGDTPEFNIGTEQLDIVKYGDVINHWNEALNNITLPGQRIRSALDEVYYGRGYQATIAREFNNLLVLPTELKKYFMDELNGIVDADMVVLTKSKFGKAIQQNVEYFSNIFISK